MQQSANPTHPTFTQHIGLHRPLWTDRSRHKLLSYDDDGTPFTRAV